MHDYSQRQVDEPVGQPWKNRGPSVPPYTPDGSQSRSYRHRDERPQGQGDRKGRRPQNRYDQRLKNERPQRNYDRQRDYHGPPNPRDSPYRDEQSTTSSPSHPPVTSTRDRTGQSLPRDHRSDNTGSGSAADSDTGIDDFAWDEKTIFTEPTRVSSPIPLAARALSAECNVDDFAQSIRDTKEWSFMQYHPAMLEPGNSHLNMLDKYKSALESWKHSQYQYNKKGHNSKRYKGRNDAGRYHNKSYDPNGYSNKPRGNGRFHNKLPDYEQVSGPWGEAPQHISGLPEPSRHNASSENFGPRYTQYAAGRFVAGQANGDDRWLGHKRPEFEREFRHSPDAHRKRGWTELQNDAGGFRTKTHHSEAYYEYQERSSKRSKYLSPEPGEIAEDSDHPYDGRSDSFTPSRQEPFEEEHRGIVDRGRHDYAKHNSEKSRDALGVTEIRTTRKEIRRLQFQLMIWLQPQSRERWLKSTYRRTNDMVSTKSGIEPILLSGRITARVNLPRSTKRRIDIPRSRYTTTIISI